MRDLLLIDPELWSETRAGARAGRGFRYQDAAAAWLAAEAWRGELPWTVVIPEGVDDITLHGAALEYRAQLKSRHNPRASFTINEAAKYIAKAAESLPSGWETDPRLRIALLLERPVAGLEPTGWLQSIAESNQCVSALMTALGCEMKEWNLVSIEALMARTHLVVEPDPMMLGVAALSGSGMVEASRRLVMQQLREEAGAAADANYAATAEQAVTMGVSDVQSRIDSVRGVIDPAGYLSLTAGLCDIADFEQPLPSASFYEGVNVMPGHVGTGLVFARPEPTADILGALEARRFGLVAGPSGSGKSALAWLAAYHTRHAVRWYRVRRLQVEDVPRLVQLAKLLEASAERPVGFVVDDVGRPETDGWDGLVREIEAHAGILAIGTVREEDIFLLSSAARTLIVRPVLDEALAERIWRALDARGTVAFSHWREPFEQSRGLLLEYAHLLTAGERLDETIREQVRRRLAEGRDDELTLLRTISFAAAQGGSVDPVRLQARENMDTPRFARALQRLIDEHAIRHRSDGALTGLHEIRSQHLDNAIREILGDARSLAIAAASETLTPDGFSAFIVRVLRQWPEEEDALLTGLAGRLAGSDSTVWTAIMHGLGLATADRIAAEWLEITRAADVEDRVSHTMLTLALANSDMGDSELFAKVKPTQEAFAKVAVPDLRSLLLARLASSVKPPPMDLDAFHELTASLLALRGSATPPALEFEPEGDLSHFPIDTVLSVLTTLRDRSVEAALKLVAAAGGTDHLLERIYVECAWATRPSTGEDDGVPTVTGYVRYIDPIAQPDVHADVIRLCERMAAAAPAAELIVSDALFPNGQSAGFGDFVIASKRLGREAIPAPARVAWNRAQLRAVSRLVAAPTETQRSTSLAFMISELASRLREAGDYYCRRTKPDGQWLLRLQVGGLLASLVPPPAVDEAVAGPLQGGNLAFGDTPYTFVGGLQRLMRELTDGVTEKPRLVAARTADLARDAQDLSNPALWRMTNDPPLSVLAEIRDTLWDIRAVVGDADVDPENRRRAALNFEKVSRHHSVLRRAADGVRARADERLRVRLADIRSAFVAKGLDVEIFARKREVDRGFQWPDVEFAALAKVQSIFAWMESVETFAIVAPTLEGQPSLSYGAILADLVIPLGMTFTSTLMPSLSFAEDWGDHLPYRILRDEATRLYAACIEAIGTLSSIAAERERDLNAEEFAYFTRLGERYQNSLKEFAALVAEEPEDEDLQAAIGSVTAAWDRLVAEVDAPPGEANSVSAELTGAAQGQLTELTTEVLLMRIRLMERAALRPSSPAP